MYVAYEWTLVQTVPCFVHSNRLDALSAWHGDDLYGGRAGNTRRSRRDDLGNLQGQSASTVGTRCERGGYDAVCILKWSTGRRSPDAWCEACGESGKAAQGEGHKVKPNILFTCHWSRSAGRVGAIDSFGSDRVLARHRNLQFATKERSRHADAKQVVDAEAQTVCQVSARYGRRGTILRIPERAEHGAGLDRW